MSGAALRLDWRPFRFALPRALVTAHGALTEKRGWLLRLRHADGGLGWGEAAALDAGAGAGTGAAAAGAGPGAAGEGLAPLELSRRSWSRGALEAQLPGLPAPLAFAIGQALAELDGLGRQPGAGGWLPAPASALLLPAGPAGPEALHRALAVASPPPAMKWKVAALPDALEREALERLLALLPAGTRLRLDANGGWDRATAAAWADRLAADPRLEWLEQPLAPQDGKGLLALARRVPVALDESLRCGLPVPEAWPGWWVRRPAVEGDPRPLLRALAAGSGRLMISTALETGIGWRLVAHLAALQQRGPTPTAPGLAPGWRPSGGLFDADPARVWEAAA
ncbi:MAG: enolase C-terminal domain-like protein [Cyanobium sp.]